MQASLFTVLQCCRDSVQTAERALALNEGKQGVLSADSIGISWHRCSALASRIGNQQMRHRSGGSMADCIAKRLATNELISQNTATGPRL